MSASAKKLSDQDKTSEFQIPEELLKKTEQLKTEHAQVSQQLEAAKKELPSRKQDESTNIFNLRQMEVARKVEQLEQKKISTEKQLLAILDKQKKQFNGDLQKVSKYLQQEKQKKNQLDKSVLARLTQLAESKQQLQQDLEWVKENQSKYYQNHLEVKQSLSDVVYRLHSELQHARKFEERFQQSLQQLEHRFLGLKDELSVPVKAPVEETKSMSSDLIEKKVIFKQHLENILSPDQLDIVTEMVEDLFTAISKSQKSK